MKASLRAIIQNQVRYATDGGDYIFKSPVDGRPIEVTAETKNGWDHVSVRRKDRPPTWHEMQFIAFKFFADNEYAVQYHIPHSKEVPGIVDTYTLHWWHNRDGMMPVPEA